MPYNSYFPANYQPYYPNANYGYNVPQVQPQQAQNVQMPSQTAVQNNQPMTSGIIWVQGEAGAKSYLVAPNTTVQLWDSERQTIYIKSADASGMPSIKTLDYTIRDMPQNSVSFAQNSPQTAFATKDEVNALAEQITALRGDFEGLAKRRTGRVQKEGVSEDE